jgi:hypothetical protein
MPCVWDGDVLCDVLLPNEELVPQAEAALDLCAEPNPRKLEEEGVDEKVGVFE